MKNASISGIFPVVVAIGAPLGSEKSCFNTRFVNNSKVRPALVEANLVRRDIKNKLMSRVEFLGRWLQWW